MYIADVKSNRMKKIILIITLLIGLSISDGFSQDRSIKFTEKPWQEIVALAKQENKLIFLDAYASWCGPCKWMAANMFTNDSIADYFNKTFICASFDMEKGEGLDLRKKFGVRAYPSLIFINTSENMVHERVGAPQKVHDYIEMAKIAQTPDEGLAAYMKKYTEGDLSPQFIQTLLTRLAEAYISTDAVIKKYFATQKESDLQNRVNWNIIYRFVGDINDPVFDYFFKHRHEYAKMYSKDSVDSKISGVYTNSLQTVLQRPNAKQADSLYLVMKEKVKTSGFEGADKVIFATNLQRLQMRGKTTEFLDLAYEGMDKYCNDDPQMLCRVAQIVSSVSGDPKYQDKALSWFKRSIALSEEPQTLDSYAYLLSKMGRKDEAIAQENKAIDLQKKRHLSAQPYEDALKRMETPK